MIQFSYMKFQPKQFSFRELTGISQKQLDVHLKLYEGYVTHTNKLQEVLEDLVRDSEKNAYALAEVKRRLGFEWNGMRMHEHYFEQWEGEHIPLSDSLEGAMAKQWGGFIMNMVNEFKAVAMMRGIGRVYSFIFERLKKLRVFAGPNHTHTAQNPVPVK